MKWPWSQPAPEVRNYSDALLANLYEAAGQSRLPASSGSAATLASTWIGRALSTATLTPGAGSIPFFPVDLAAVGRGLVESGQSLWVLQGRRWVQCSPRAEVSIVPGLPESWLYVLTPSGSTRTSRALGRDVLHFKWSSDATRPGVGVGPLENKAAKLAATLEGILLNEASGATGYLMGLPPGSDDFLGRVKERIASLRGRLLSIENSFKANPMMPEADSRFSIFQKPVRFGFHPPEVMLETWQAANNLVLESCGLPAQLLMKSEGMSSRELLRRVKATLLEPLMQTVLAELDKTDNVHTSKFSGDLSTDLATRARSFQNLVKSGMSIDRAAALAGLILEDEE